MFASPDTLRLFCEKIILPNMALRGTCTRAPWCDGFSELPGRRADSAPEHEEELFEDNPVEYINRDLDTGLGELPFPLR